MNKKEGKSMLNEFSKKEPYVKDEIKRILVFANEWQFGVGCVEETMDEKVDYVFNALMNGAREELENLP